MSHPATNVSVQPVPFDSIPEGGEPANQTRGPLTELARSVSKAKDSLPESFGNLTPLNLFYCEEFKIVGDLTPLNLF